MTLTPEEEIELLQLEDDEAIDKARDSILGFTTFTKQDYIVNWHHRVLSEYLDRFIEGDIKRLMVFMPPRNGKTELVSRRLPAQIFGKYPDSHIISASYSADLASRNNRDVQRIITTPEYKMLYPNTCLSQTNVKSTAEGSWLKNSSIFEIVGRRGTYRSAGIGGGITGMGCNYGIIDDPIKDQKEADSVAYRNKVWDWYTSTLYTRLEKDASILLTMTRWHEDDLAGRLLEQMKGDPDADQWTILSFPAICEQMGNEDDQRAIGDPLWPDKYPLNRLHKTKSTVGSMVWNSLYQQRPSAPEGSIVKRSWFKFYKEKPEKFDEIIQSWDMTFKDSKNADFVVGEVWGRVGADKYLLDLVRERMDFPTTCNAFIALSEKWPAALAKIVEDKANGPAIISMLKSKVPGIIPYSPTSSKEARLNAVSPEIESGNVHLPDPLSTPWVGDFIEEVCHFPKGKNDDMVDSMSQALIRFQSSTKKKVTVSPLSLTKSSSWSL